MFSGLKIIVFYLFNPYRLISSIVRPVATIIPKRTQADMSTFTRIVTSFLYLTMIL
jgi:hypothetical protein